MIHVKRVAGQAPCSVLKIASAWQASPIAESLSRHTDSGGEFEKELRGDMPLLRIPTESGAILYDPSRIDHPRGEDFEPKAAAAAGRVEGGATGRGSVWFVRARDKTGAWVLRHYHRGGLVARVLADRYLWCGENATRPFRELALLAEIEALGLPAARPVAARYVRAGALYRADLLSVALEDVETLAGLLAKAPATAPWRAVGATLRAFHDAGIWHADLNAHNVLVDGGGGVSLVDFDRGRRRAPGAWARGNLARLRHSLEKLARAAGMPFDDAWWAALEAGYETPRSAPPR